MEPLHPAEILFAADRDTSLRIEWLRDPPAFPHDVQQYLDDRWLFYTDAAHAAGKTLFNGAVTLYRGHRADGNTLTLILSPGDYRTHLVTAVRDRAWFAQHAPQCIFPGLGNSVLLTSNDQAVFGLRSPKVASHPGKAHVFGGVLDELNSPATPAGVDGILHHLQTELSEELNLSPQDMIGAPRLLGLFRDPFLAQPELVWHWATRADVQEMRAHLAASEHAGLLTLPLFAAASNEQKARIDKQLTPLARTVWQIT